MINFKDVFTVLCILLLLVASYFAIWVLVFLLVGAVIYGFIRLIKSIPPRRRKWK